jgi:hypothetical protein
MTNKIQKQTLDSSQHSPLKPSHFSFENALWIGGSIIIIVALLFALTNNWELLTSSQQYALALIPLVLLYAGALTLSSCRLISASARKFQLLKECLYIAFGILCPFGLFPLFFSIYPILELAYLMIPPILLMLIAATLYQENQAKRFLLFYFIATYLMIIGILPAQNVLPGWLLAEIEMILLGLILLGTPRFLPSSWKAPLKSWSLSLGAFFILLGATLSIWLPTYYTYLNAGIALLIILGVLALGIYLKNRIIFAQIMIFYIFHVLQFGMFFFKNSPTLWPLILGITGIGWILLGFIYVKFKK